MIQCGGSASGNQLHILGGTGETVNVGRAAMWILDGGGLFGGVDGIEEAEELLDASDTQGVMHALAHANQRQLSSRMLPSDIGADQSADPRRIHVGHVGEIDNQTSRLICPHGRLEIEYGGQNQSAGKCQNPVSSLASRLIVDPKRVFRHPKILTPE